MTEREQFENAMLVTVIMPRPHLAAHIATIFERHEIGDCGYKQMWLDSAWIGWQAARATPALPQGVGEWIDSAQVQLGDESPAGWGNYIPSSEARTYLSGMAIVPVEFIHVLQDAPEINPSNYDHDQVCRLNTAVNEALAMLAANTATASQTEKGEGE